MVPCASDNPRVRGGGSSAVEDGAMVGHAQLMVSHWLHPELAHQVRAQFVSAAASFLIRCRW